MKPSLLYSETVRVTTAPPLCGYTRVDAYVARRLHFGTPGKPSVRYLVQRFYKANGLLHRERRQVLHPRRRYVKTPRGRRIALLVTASQ